MVIIIGGNHHNTLGVIRSLGRVGIPPYVILTSGNETSFVLKSKYIQGKSVVNGSDEAIRLLLSKFAFPRQRAVVIACHDEISSALDVNRDKLLPYFVIPGSNIPGRITKFMNKQRMGELASQVGLTVPVTTVLNKFSVKEKGDLHYPCITKPIDSKSGSKSEISVCNNIQELESFLNGTKEVKDYIIQQFIVKDFEFQLIGCSLEGGAEIIIPGVSIIIRQSKTSNTGFLHYRELDNSFTDTVEKAKLFIRTVGYSGLFSVEFLRDKSGKDFFMEMNYRNDGNTISVFNAGVNLPYIWFLNGIGADYQKEVKDLHEEYVMPEFAELALYQQGLISRKEWKQDMEKATSYMDFAPDDPAPTDGWRKFHKQKTLSLLRRLKHKLFD